MKAMARRKKAGKTKQMAGQAFQHKLKHVKAEQFYGTTEFAVVSKFMEWYGPISNKISLQVQTYGLSIGEPEPYTMTVYYEVL